MPEWKAGLGAMFVEMAIADGRLRLIHYVMVDRRQIEDGIVDLVSGERDREATTGLEVARENAGQRRPELLAWEPHAEDRRSAPCLRHVNRVRSIEDHHSSRIGLTYALDRRLLLC